MCSGVMKSGSPRLKSKTLRPSAFICLARAPAARVADGCTADAIFERANMILVRGCEAGERGTLTTSVRPRVGLHCTGRSAFAGVVLGGESDACGPLRPAL